MAKTKTNFSLWIWPKRKPILVYEYGKTYQITQYFTRIYGVIPRPHFMLSVIIEDSFHIFNYFIHLIIPIRLINDDNNHKVYFESKHPLTHTKSCLQACSLSYRLPNQRIQPGERRYPECWRLQSIFIQHGVKLHRFSTWLIRTKDGRWESRHSITINCNISIVEIVGKICFNALSSSLRVFPDVVWFVCSTDENIWSSNNGSYLLML